MRDNSTRIKIPVIPKPIRYSQVQQDSFQNLFKNNKYTMQKQPLELSLIHRSRMMKKENRVLKRFQTKAVKPVSQKLKKQSKEITTVYCIRKNEKQNLQESTDLHKDSLFKGPSLEGMAIKSSKRDITGVSLLLQRSKSNGYEHIQRNKSTIQFIRFDLTKEKESPIKEGGYNFVQVVLNAGRGTKVTEK